MSLMGGDWMRTVKYCPFCGESDLEEIYDDLVFCKQCEKEFAVLWEPGAVKMTCEGCNYIGSDCCFDCMWYVCDHPKFRKKYPEGRGLQPYLKKPDWCPLEDKEW